jgi:hypothetical protein
MRAGFILAFLVLYAVATLLQWAAWRWLARVAPRWVTRYRRPALTAFIALYLLPFARGALFLHPRSALWPALAALGMLWHLTIAMSMSVIGIFRAGRAIYERIAGRGRRAESADESAPVNAAAGYAGTVGALDAKLVRGVERVARLGDTARALRMVDRRDRHPAGEAASGARRFYDRPAF